MSTIAVIAVIAGALYLLAMLAVGAFLWRDARRPWTPDELRVYRQQHGPDAPHPDELNRNRGRR